MSHVQDIIGKSPAAEKIRAFISKAAKTDWPVFLTGETGVGKEVVARAIHRLSSRNGGPFVPVNCAAIPLTLAESEIFGYCAGAFTDARREKSGLVEEGAGGTVFLDEVTECSQDLQAKLLRLLEHKEFRRVGEAAMRKAQARFILASNEDPVLAMKSGV